MDISIFNCIFESMAKKFFINIDVEEHPNVQTKVKQHGNSIHFDFSGWVTPKETCLDLLQPRSEIKRLDKAIRGKLYDILSQQRYFIRSLHIDKLSLSAANIPVNQRAYFSFELVLYQNRTNEGTPSTDFINKINQQFVDLFISNSYFNFNRNKLV